jgi:glycerol-3-phosphate acyltransferase PlsY
MSLPVERSLLILIAAAYLAGSIPFGLLVGWMKGIDVRKAGSGNIGASNVGRLLGRKYFFLVMFLDLLKSLMPMLAGSYIVKHYLPPHSVPTAQQYVLWLMVGFAAILGHMFSVFLKFTGGKGVATSTGVFLGLWPFYTWPGLVTIAVFIIAFMATRYISVGSLCAAVTFPIAYLIFALAMNWKPFAGQSPLLIFAIMMAAMVIFKHRSNIARLRAGTENRMGRTKNEDRVVKIKD